MITVEDFNSVLKEYGGSDFYHCIDTSKVSLADFNNVQYDFIETMSKTTSSGNCTYTFKIVNGAWTGGYWITDANGDWLNVTGSYNSSTNVLTIVTTEKSIQLYLCICNACTSFLFEKLNWILLDLNSQNIISPAIQYSSKMYLKVLNPSYTMPNTIAQDTTSIPVHSTEDADIFYIQFKSTTTGETRFANNTTGYPNRLYTNMDFIKYPIPLRLNPNELVVGKINQVNLDYDNTYNNYVNTFEVEYNNKVTAYNWSSKKFNLDLTGKSDLKPITIKLLLDAKASTDFYGYSYDFKLPIDYLKVSNASTFASECGNNGAYIFRLNSNLTLTADVTITHNVVIIGSGKTINLDGHSLIVSDGVKLELSDCTLSNGDNAIIQKANSEVELNGVTFTHCQSTKYNNLGSCICCDIDLDSLDIEDDFRTVLTECEFYNNQSAILSGGTLIVTGCKLHNTDLAYMDKHNVSFIYQADGSSNIKNSILDIDYTNTSLCTNQESIGFAQCLIQCGQTAKINNQSYSDLMDKGLDLTGNATHIFAKYYYPRLSECVFTSPLLDKEDKAFCYCLTGLNKVFKENVQITKASDNAENTYRKIQW